MSQRLNYRTPDGIIHLWTQEEIDAHIRAMNVVPYTPTQFDETRTTIEMLHDLLFHRNTPRLDHETVQDLLSRIDTMAEPLKEMVQAMEVEVVPPGIRRLAQEARQQMRDGHVEEGGFAIE